MKLFGKWSRLNGDLSEEKRALLLQPIPYPISALTGEA
jgi:hypothetical protein